MNAQFIFSAVLAVGSFAIGCSSPSSTSSGPASDSGAPSSADDMCVSTCKHDQTAGCAPDPTCEEKCRAHAKDFPAVCNELLAAGANCYNAAPVTCSASNRPTVGDACKAEEQAYVACAAKNTPDGGLFCSASTNDSACAKCEKSKCCAEFTAALSDADGLAYSDCVKACHGAVDCVATCGTQHTSGQKTLAAATACVMASCGGDCGGDAGP